MPRTFIPGQHVGILVGLQSVDGPHVGAYGVVARVVNFWGADEYVVTTDADPEGLVYGPALLVDATDRAASMAAHPAGKGRPVKIGGNYPRNVDPHPSVNIGPAMRQSVAEVWDSLYGNPWNV